ncbi:MAG: hypothetical protein UR56_C0005G0011 [Candidatus Roizmanbacteria bacterium GW2011_GWC2_34_23]|uniref:Uncharacterized protein n=1 Tax=Candidatus Roizmanbacteria bacterium GW2011_GWC2_34_23 TaxID=1618484 RepID=A0A0G0DI05_9BACT|nr:MAG: hypothetical protein UR56_C0005G0011 [Candidatus Roizmanbacteria bacterium GW2011_GWC2_34_23]
MNFDNQTVGMMIFYGVGFLFIIASGVMFLISKK